MFASLLAYPLLLPGSSPVPVSDAATMVSSSTWMTAMMMVTVMVMMVVVMMMMETLRTTPWSSIGYSNCHYWRYHTCCNSRYDYCNDYVFAHEFTLSFQIHIRLCGYYWLNYLKNGNIITTYSFCAGALAVTLETGQAFANHGSHSSDGTDNGGQWRQ